MRLPARTAKAYVPASAPGRVTKRGRGALTAMSTHQHKLAWIQALRGVAACMVVMVHDRGALQGMPGGAALAQAMLPLGGGVDLFFLISGFLMVLTTRDFDGSRAYAWKFTAKRVARIWPLFVIVTLLAMAIDQPSIHGLLKTSVLLPYLEGLAFIPHNPAASGIYFQMGVGVAWTLCFECYFYAVFAVCMLFGRWRYTAMALWFAATLIAIPLLRGGYNLGVASQPLIAGWRYANLPINPIVWEFVLGMLAGWLYGARAAVTRGAIVYGATILSLTILLIGWHRLGMVNFFGPHGWGAVMAILFFGIVMLAKSGGIHAPAWLVWVGEISYSLYLVHVYAFELVQRGLAHSHLLPPLSNPALFVMRPVLAVACAWLSFRYLEEPASTWMREKLLRARWPAVIAPGRVGAVLGRRFVRQPLRVGMGAKRRRFARP